MSVINRHGMTISDGDIAALLFDVCDHRHAGTIRYGYNQEYCSACHRHQGKTLTALGEAIVQMIQDSLEVPVPSDSSMPNGVDLQRKY